MFVVMFVCYNEHAEQKFVNRGRSVQHMRLLFSPKSVTVLTRGHNITESAKRNTTKQSVTLARGKV